MAALEQLNELVALGTLGMEALAVLLLAVFIWGKGTPLARLAEKWALPFSLLVVLVGIVVSLVYSDYFGIEACWLCWYQRVFLYPQVVLFAVALWKKDTRVAYYSIALSVFGAAVALYQHYLQMGGTGVLPCPASGGDCAQRFIFEYGHITFPWIALTTFALLIVLMLYVRRSGNAARS
ncbi:MAG: disulfide bond formation protein B [Patescibacteria group bacterium]